MPDFCKEEQTNGVSFGEAATPSDSTAECKVRSALDSFLALQTSVYFELKYRNEMVALQ